MVNDTSIYNRNVLKHHGIEGQKWGVKNGPPYPLDEKTAKKVKSKSKEEAMKSGKASEVDAYKFEMSNDEIRQAINRIELYNKLDDLKIKEISPNKKKLNVSPKKIVSLINPTAKTTSNILDTVIKIKKLSGNK
jgi:hypothetical protein